MKTQTKPISLKKQLMSAVSMMLAAAVALGSSTYAWFVNKSRAEVKDVLFQASAGKNLEIAAAVADNTGSFDSITALGLSDNVQIPWAQSGMLTYFSSVTPDILGKNSFKYPKFESDGSATNYMTPVSAASNQNHLTLDGSNAKFIINEGWDTNMSDADANKGYNTYEELTGMGSDTTHYICAQLYFRSTEEMNVYLNEAEWAAYSGTNDKTNGISTPFITQYRPAGWDDTTDAAKISTYKKQAEDMAKALRIAFVIDNDYNDAFGAGDTIITACFDGTNSVANYTYNTINSSGNLITSGTPIDTLDTDKKIATFGTEVTDTLEKYTLQNGSTGAGTDFKNNVSIDEKTPLFTLEPSKAKRVTIYIWLEGTDKDCVNTISSYVAGIYLPFIGGYPANEGDTTITTYSLDNQFEVVEDEDTEDVNVPVDVTAPEVETPIVETPSDDNAEVEESEVIE